MRFDLLLGNSDELPVDGQRRASGDELLVAQFAPEVVRDGGGKSGAVFRDSLGSAGTRDDRGGGGMSEREPQRGGLDGDLMAPGDGLDALDLGEDLRGRLLVLELGTTDQDARAVRATNNDVYFPGRGGRHQALQRALVIEQRVAAG